MISKRLTALANMVTTGSTVADIGSDHALLLCQLAKEKRIVKGYAIDIASGPLKQAEANIKSNNYLNIECILADGLSQLPSDVNCVVIAGMGFKTIASIINNDLTKLKNLSEIIIQCNSEIWKFRQLLTYLKANIIDEIWVKDYKDYQIIKFNLLKESNYNEIETYFGPCLLKKKPLEFLQYYQKRLAKLQAFTKNPNYQKEIAILQDLI